MVPDGHRRLAGARCPTRCPGAATHDSLDKSAARLAHLLQVAVDVEHAVLLGQLDVGVNRQEHARATGAVTVGMSSGHRGVATGQRQRTGAGQSGERREQSGQTDNRTHQSTLSNKFQSCLKEPDLSAGRISPHLSYFAARTAAPTVIPSDRRERFSATPRAITAAADRYRTAQQVSAQRRRLT